MTIKKTVTIEGVRSWTGPMENYEAHKECVEHWCGGGEIETRDDAADWYDVTAHRPLFASAFEYRIKRREPQRGEIWTNADGLAYEVMRSDGSMRQLADTTIHAGGAAGERPFERLGLVYKAKSAEAYIAKQIIKEIGNNTVFAYDVLCEKAGEE